MAPDYWLDASFRFLSEIECKCVLEVVLWIEGVGMGVVSSRARTTIQRSAIAAPPTKRRFGLAQPNFVHVSTVEKDSRVILGFRPKFFHGAQGNPKSLRCSERRQPFTPTPQGEPHLSQRELPDESSWASEFCRRGRCKLLMQIQRSDPHGKCFYMGHERALSRAPARAYRSPTYSLTSHRRQTYRSQRASTILLVFAARPQCPRAWGVCATR